MAAGPVAERNQDATIYVGGLDEKVNESLLWELFVQAGPVVNVHMPKDRVTMMHQGYGFVEFLSEEDADYSIKIMNMIKLYGKPIRVNKASAHQKNLDVGANIFIGNLDPEVDEKLLYDTFSAFGVILQTPKIQRDPETGNSKGFAFINYASFEASDAAIEAMNGQYLCNRAISVSYAFKKDSKGERHGSAAERLLAAQNPLSQADRPHQLFADAPPIPVAPMGGPMGGPPPPMGMRPPPPGTYIRIIFIIIFVKINLYLDTIYFRNARNASWTTWTSRNARNASAYDASKTRYNFIFVLHHYFCLVKFWEIDFTKKNSNIIHKNIICFLGMHGMPPGPPGHGHPGMPGPPMPPPPPPPPSLFPPPPPPPSSGAGWGPPPPPRPPVSLLILYLI